MEAATINRADMLPPVSTLERYFFTQEELQTRYAAICWRIEELESSYTISTLSEVSGWHVRAAGVENAALEIVELKEAWKEAQERLNGRAHILAVCLQELAESDRSIIETYYKHKQARDPGRLAIVQKHVLRLIAEREKVERTKRVINLIHNKPKERIK